MKKQAKITIALILSSLAISACGASNAVLNNLPLQIAPVENIQPAESIEANAIKYNIIEIRGIGPVYQKKLNEIGLKNTDQLLKATAKRKDRKALAEKLDISEKLLLHWANHIDIMRIKGIGPKQSNWLEAVGVDSIPELAQRNAENLHGRLEIANNIDPNRKFVHRMPSVAEVQKWIEGAKKTEPLVEVTH